MGRLPYEYWLKYLLAAARLSTDQVAVTCELHQLPAPDPKYLAHLRNELGALRSPLPTSWLRERRIKELATGDPNAVAARELLTQQRVRTKLEALLITGMSPKDASFYLEALVRQHVPEEVISLYRHYFWNVDLLSIGQWSDFLANYQGVHGAMLRSYYNHGEAHTLWKLGYATSIDTKEAVRGILFDSIMRQRELNSHANNQDTALSARAWADTMFKALAYLERDEDVMERTMDGLAQYVLRLGRRDISSVQSLNGKEGST